VRELHDEKIDVIEWNPAPTAFIAKAISPARVNGVFLHESIEGAKNALVVVPEDQLSLAIGRDGQNARLAAKLTGWRIDIKSLSEAISDWLFSLSNNEEFKELAEEEKESIDKAEEIMARKSEGRILSNDDYDFLNAFNERLENVSQAKRAEKRAAYLEKREKILESIPDAAFDMDLSESGLSDSIIEGLAEIKITNAGNLILTAGLKPEKIMDVSGIGPKTFESIEEFGKKLPDLVPEVEEIEEEPVAEEEAPVAEVAEEAEGAETPEAETDAEAAEAEAAPDETAEGEAETEQAAAEVAPQEPEEDADEGEKKVESVKSFEELFKLDLESIDSIDQDEEDGEPSGKKSKKKRSKKSRRIEYDPDLDMTIAKKKHKRSDGEWDEWEVDI
jgi:N utilization substance protein A